MHGRNAKTSVGDAGWFTVSDNLRDYGLTIRLSSVPTFPEYTAAKRRMYGSGWLSRLWCWHFRPMLFPKAQQREAEVFEAVQARHNVAIANAVLDAYQDTLL